MNPESVAGVILFLIGLMYLIYWFLTKEFNYWKDKNVPFLEPVVIFGSVKNELLNNITWLSFINKCYVTFKNHGFGGVFFVRKPTVWFCDPKFIEKVLVEDFAYFHDRWIVDEGSAEGSTLFHSIGEKWRSLRLKLAPAFASVKVKGMFQQILSSAENMLQKVEEASDLQDGVDVESLSTDFATEALVSCLCGVQMSNSKEATEFEKALDILYKPSIRRNVAIVLSTFLPPKLMKWVGLKMAPQEAVDTLSNVVESILTHRKQNGTKRNDILQTMQDLKEQEENADKVKEGDGLYFKDKITNIKNYIMGSNAKRKVFFTEETIAAQILSFLSGGIKPIAVTITFALFEIAKSPTIQNNLQKEIDLAIRKHKKWNLISLREMTYLDQVIQETLRLYSFNTLLFRTVKRKYKIPGTEVTLDEAMKVFIPLVGLHKDPDFYPCPLEFRPERWEGNNYRSSCTFLPFGHGPRICLSIRLAVLTMKLCLARVFSQHRVSISQRMTLPLQFDGEFYYKVKGGMWLKFDNRET